jgi:hypothetical protein
VPAHLVQPLCSWVRSYFVDSYNTIKDLANIRYLGLMHEVVAPANGDERDVLRQILNQCATDEHFCLDMIDAVLYYGRPHAAAINDLELILITGGANTSVAPDKRSLVGRLDQTTVDQANQVMTSVEESSIELAEAWKNAYGRKPNASDAWDHAIKAVETVLIPVVCPSKSKPTLADVAGCLKAQPDQWVMQLDSNGTIGPIETVEAMLRLIWPNPDRHGGTARRSPTLEEAQAVVQLAVTLVAWGRAGVISKK